MTREAYVRVSSKGTRFEVIAGLEYRDGDDWSMLRRDVRHEVEFATVYSLPDEQPPEVAARVERFFAVRWPDRAYFVEVASVDDESDWVQVYDPRGFVKERCPCTEGIEKLEQEHEGWSDLDR